MYSDIAISHKKEDIKDPKRNLRIFNKIISDGVVLNPREQFYYARELYYNQEYDKAISIFNEFLSLKKGWIEDSIDACLNMAKCYRALNDKENALKALIRSFEFDKPRAEICCELGEYFYEITNYEVAIFWYKQALSCNLDDRMRGFKIVDCYGYIPYIQLCVCYDKLADKKNAKFYNDKAGELKPNDKAYLYNKKYFEGLGQI